MPVYRNPNFRRLPCSFAHVFESSSPDSFFALPRWYDLMARHGVPEGTEILGYTDKRPGSTTALLMQAATSEGRHVLGSLANAHSLEHGILYAPSTDLEEALARIVSEILAERPQWDCITLAELDPREPRYPALTAALREAGLLVECTFSSGTWYEETVNLSFADYVAARPSELRNTWIRKRRKLVRSHRLTKSFFDDDLTDLDRAIADYEAVYAASWKPAELFPGFVPALIRLLGELGALRLGIYYIDAVPMAVQFWIVWNRRAVICKLAHDKRFDGTSLGTLLTMDMFERVLGADRPHEISFGRGDDRYKRLWLPKRRERWGIVAANPRTFRGLRLGVRRQAALLYHRLLESRQRRPAKVGAQR
jgi:hypothetical protein